MVFPKNINFLLIFFRIYRIIAARRWHYERSWQQGDYGKKHKTLHEHQQCNTNRDMQHFRN